MNENLYNRLPGLIWLLDFLLLLVGRLIIVLIIVINKSCKLFISCLIFLYFHFRKSHWDCNNMYRIRDMATNNIQLRVRSFGYQLEEIWKYWRWVTSIAITPLFLWFFYLLNEISIILNLKFKMTGWVTFGEDGNMNLGTIATIGVLATLILLVLVVVIIFFTHRRQAN